MMSRFNPESQAWEQIVITESTQLDSPDFSELTTCTWNVLMDSFRGWRWWERVTQPPIRYAQILVELQTLSPDVISLNEVTLQFLEMIQDHDWVRKHYYLIGTKSIQDKSLKMGNLILSRYPPNDIQEWYLAELKRPGLAITLNHRLAVVSAHLTSHVKNVEQRRIEMDELYHKISGLPVEQVLLQGDLNLHTLDEDQLFMNQSLPTTDCWLALHPDDPGYTFDSRTNQMIQEIFMGFETRRMRLDRILLVQKETGQPMQLEEMSIIGTQRISDSEEAVEISRKRGLWNLIRDLIGWEVASREANRFCSDHYGLFARIKF